MKTPQDQYIKIGKINTRYWVEGEQGHPVILIHGLGGYIENWLPNLDSLALKHRVYALDLPGHGLADKPLDISYKIADLAKFVVDFMTAFQLESAHIVGHSLGGAIATRLALLFPAAADKLVLVGSGGLGRESSYVFKIMSIPILGEYLTRPSPSGLTDTAKYLVFDPSMMTPEAVEIDYQMASQPNAQKTFLKTLRDNANIFGQDKSMYVPNVNSLETIKNPVLVIWGRQDKLVPVKHAEVAANGFPNVLMKILEECGHQPMSEHPQAFNEIVQSFLRD
jgi:4,5:9,10-diseco-3-hydroxy-5,9,17-trioxoandrosta-1(10),2-diene-4-oate hydrolase